MAVVTISCDNMVVFLHQGDAAHGDRFLADVEVEESAHFAGVVILERDLFEASDAAELAVEFPFSFRRQALVDGGLGRAGLLGSGWGPGFTPPAADEAF